MKNSLKYIMAIVAFFGVVFAFSPVVNAQDAGSTVQYSKGVSGPDANGVYTISLEAYVTGSVTVTTNYYPADIFLLLDFSGSMTGSGSGSAANMPAMQNAVTTFIQTIQEKNQNVLEDSNGGYRIAIIPYSNSTYNSQNGCNALYNVDLFTATPQGATTGGTLTYNNLTVWPSTGGGTRSGDAMVLAEDLIAAQNSAGAYTDKDGYENSKRTKIVILFTDGVPGSQGASAQNWANNYPNGGNEMTDEANECIESSSNIISNYGGVVYTVGLFATSVTNYPARLRVVKTYMAYASSDYPEETEMPANTSGLLESTYSGTYSIVVDKAGDLAGIFESISSSVGGDYSASSASSVLVDIVASSFSIPADTDLGDVKVYKDTCTQASKTAIITFADRNSYVDITKQVTLETDKATGEVTVTGFDYGANWCGWNDETNGPHGNKLVLEIPITLKDDAVGGPAVETNAPGSKLIIKDSDDNVISENEFISPTLPIPVQIWIQKQGLVGDDSAVFTIRRIEYRGTYQTDEDGNYILDADGNKQYIEYDKIDKKEWDTFTKVVVNAQNMDANGLVKITGLDPNYVYRIEEDAWGFGYTYQDNGILHTIGGSVENPFVFVNTPKDIKKAESVVRNVFSERTTEITTTD